MEHFLFLLYNHCFTLRGVKINSCIYYNNALNGMLYIIMSSLIILCIHGKNFSHVSVLGPVRYLHYYLDNTETNNLCVFLRYR